MCFLGVSLDYFFFRPFSCLFFSILISVFCFILYYMLLSFILFFNFLRRDRKEVDPDGKGGREKLEVGLWKP